MSHLGLVYKAMSFSKQNSIKLWKKMKIPTGTLFLTFGCLLSFVELSLQVGGILDYEVVANQIIDLPNHATYRARHTGTISVQFTSTRAPVTVLDGGIRYTVNPPPQRGLFMYEVQANQIITLPNHAHYRARHPGTISVQFENRNGPNIVTDNGRSYTINPPATRQASSSGSSKKKWYRWN